MLDQTFSMTKAQVATGSERDVEDFERDRKPNPKHKSKDKSLLLFKGIGRSVNRTAGGHIFFLLAINESSQ